MISNPPTGRVYFFKTDKTIKNKFSPILEINSNFDTLKSIVIGSGRAIGITSQDELLEWTFDKKTQSSITTTPPSNKQLKQTKNDFLFLLSKPVFQFNKLKFKSILLNKTMCLGLDTMGNVLVWGQNKEGLLGLGYDVTSVDSPTKLEGLSDIKEISLSDFHAVCLNNNGQGFSWGIGKYGELGLDKCIYTPTPQRINSDNTYSKVFAGNLITCFIDLNGHFSYYGVIIKQLKGYNSSITVKNLLNDQNNFDNKSLFLEKDIAELENELFENIIIGNGFIGLLSKRGLLFTLEYSDKLTMLYSKYFIYSIAVSHNEIYGLCKDGYSNKTVNVTSKIHVMNNNSIGKNYYLCKWSSKFPEKEVFSEIWTTTIFKITEEIQNIQNISLLSSNQNRSLVLLIEKEDRPNNLNNSFFTPLNRKLLDSSTNNDLSIDNSMNVTYNEFPNIKRVFPENFLTYDSEYDDSFNKKFKRTKSRVNANISGIFIDNSAYGNYNYYTNNTLNRSRSYSPNLNKTYNTNTFNSVVGGLSQIGKSTYFPGSNMGNYNYNTNTNLSNFNTNNNLYTPNNKSLNKNETGENYDESVEMKEKELNNYKQEVDNIIKNFKEKQREQKQNLQHKYARSTGHHVIFTGGNQNRTAVQNDLLHNRGQSTDLNLSFSTTSPNIDKSNISGNKIIINKNSKLTKGLSVDTSNNLDELLKDNSNIIRNDLYSDTDENNNIFNRTTSGINLSYLSPNPNANILNKRYGPNINIGNNNMAHSTNILSRMNLIGNNSKRFNTESSSNELYNSGNRRLIGSNSFGFINNNGKRVNFRLSEDNMHNIRVIKTLSDSDEDRSRSKDRIKKDFGLDDINQLKIKKTNSYRIHENNEDNVKLRMQQRLISLDKIRQLEKKGKIFSEDELEKHLNNPQILANDPNDMLFYKNIELQNNPELYNQFTGKFNQEYNLNYPKNKGNSQLSIINLSGKGINPANQYANKEGYIDNNGIFHIFREGKGINVNKVISGGYVDNSGNFYPYNDDINNNYEKNNIINKGGFIDDKGIFHFNQNQQNEIMNKEGFIDNEGNFVNSEEGSNNLDNKRGYIDNKGMYHPYDNKNSNFLDKGAYIDNQGNFYPYIGNKNDIVMNRRVYNEGYEMKDYSGEYRNRDGALQTGFIQDKDGNIINMKEGIKKENMRIQGFISDNMSNRDYTNKNQHYVQGKMIYEDENDDDNVNMRSGKFYDSDEVNKYSNNKKINIQTGEYYEGDYGNYNIHAKDTFGNNNFVYKDQYSDRNIKNINTGTFSNENSGRNNMSRRMKSDREIEDLANFAESQRLKKSSQDENNLSNIIIDNNNESYVNAYNRSKMNERENENL